MRNIADVLTASRFVLAMATFVLIVNDQWKWAVIAFIAAALSDAFDGMAARKWPPVKRWYPMSPHLFDNWADITLVQSGMLGLVFVYTDYFIGLWLFVGVLAIAAIMVASVNALKRRESTYAEHLDVLHGWIYALELVALLIWLTVMVFSGLSLVVVLITYGLAAVILLRLKWERATTRPENRTTSS